MTSPILTPRPGSILISPPLSEDTNFQRTVVLVCEHSEPGSFGLVLNRELTIHLGDVLDELASYTAPLYLGGPVEQNTLHYVHRLGSVIPEAVELADGIYWGGDFETVKSLVRMGRASEKDLRFFLGYSGWSAGQLMEEIEAGGWILTDADEEIVFSEDQNKLWRAVLRQMGGDFALLANFPDDPRLN